MNFPLDLITADEYDRLRAQHVLLTGTGRPLAWANPAVRLRNALAPPMDIQHDADGRWWAEFDLGEAASDGLTKPNFTGTITLRDLRGTPLGPVRAEAFIEREEGFKTSARGFLGDAEGWTVEADGVFIEPVWARSTGAGA